MESMGNGWDYVLIILFLGHTISLIITPLFRHVIIEFSRWRDKVVAGI